MPSNRTEQTLARLADLTPRQIVAELDRYIVGQADAKKAAEIARRLAKLAGAPFIKVEASKFTEVGYVGRDVEGMVRDLVDSAIDMVRTEREVEIEDLAHEKVEERLLDLLLPPPDKAVAGSAARSAAENPPAARSAAE